MGSKKIIAVRRLKRPYMKCLMCRDLGLGSIPETLAPTQITTLRQGYSSLWLCDRHVAQFKQEVSEIQEVN